MKISLNLKALRSMKMSNEKDIYNQFSLNFTFRNAGDRALLMEKISRILDGTESSFKFKDEVCVETADWHVDEDDFDFDFYEDNEECHDKDQIIESLKRNEGCMYDVSDELRMPITSLYDRIKKLGIKPEDFSNSSNEDHSKNSVVDDTIYALSKNSGNVAKAANDLCVTKSTIYRRIKKFGLRR